MSQKSMEKDVLDRKPSDCPKIFDDVYSISKEAQYIFNGRSFDDESSKNQCPYFTNIEKPVSIAEILTRGYQDSYRLVTWIKKLRENYEKNHPNEDGYKIDKIFGLEAYNYLADKSDSNFIDELFEDVLSTDAYLKTNIYSKLQRIPTSKGSCDKDQDFGFSHFFKKIQNRMSLKEETKVHSESESPSFKPYTRPSVFSTNIPPPSIMDQDSVLVQEITESNEESTSEEDLVAIESVVPEPTISHPENTISHSNIESSSNQNKLPFQEQKTEKTYCFRKPTNVVKDDQAHSPTKPKTFFYTFSAPIKIIPASTVTDRSSPITYNFRKPTSIY